MTTTNEALVSTHAPRAHGDLRLEGTSRSFELRAPEAVDAVLRALAAERRELVFVLADGPLRARLEPDGPFRVAFVDRAPSFGREPTFACLFGLRGVTFELEGQLVCRSEQWFVRVGTLKSVEGRTISRVALARGCATLRWTEADGALRSRWVRDLTPDGVQIEASEDLPDQLDALLVIDGQTTPCVARPRRRIARANGPPTIGLALSSGTRRSAVVESYLRKRFPSLRARREANGDAVERLFADSGYLDLRHGTRPTRGWLELDDDSVSRDVVFEAADGSLVGHISVSRVYRRTWLSHQLASLRSPEANAARGALYLYAASVPTVLDGKGAMVMAYYDRAKPWHKVFFESFVRWVDDPALVTVVPFDRFEHRETPTDDVRRGASVSIGPLSSAEIGEAIALVRASLPPIAVTALDISADHLVVDDLHPAYATSPHARGRQALGLRTGDKLVGVALCEISSRELSIFNVMNMAQVFLRTPAPPLDAQLAFLSAIRRFYRKRDVADPIVVARPRTLQADAEPGTILAETMGCWICSGQMIRQYESFLRFHLQGHNP